MLRVGSVGLRTRPLRAVLSALGVAIGIASVVAVVGISTSSRADLLRTIDALGTNLLTIRPGQSFVGGGASELPAEATARLGVLPGTQRVSAVAEASGVGVRRNARVDAQQTSGITLLAADRTLPSVVGATVRVGRFLRPGDEQLPVVVLGAVAAKRLGITDLAGGPQVRVGDRDVRVVGILAPVAFDASLDRAAFMSEPQVRARRESTDELTPTRIYVRADEAQLPAVRARAAGTANPEHPEEVEISRPSDALVAKAAADSAFTSLLLGLGAVALLVGAVGIANVMVISVLERRAEIGLRRALGATRGHITSQFLTESVLIGALGGSVGAVIGIVITAGYAWAQELPVVVPVVAALSGIGVAVIIGALAGLWPSTRAARLSPTEALRAP